MLKGAAKLRTWLASDKRAAFVEKVQQRFDGSFDHDPLLRLAAEVGADLVSQCGFNALVFCVVQMPFAEVIRIGRDRARRLLAEQRYEQRYGFLHSYARYGFLHSYARKRWRQSRAHLVSETAVRARVSCCTPTRLDYPRRSQIIIYTVPALRENLWLHFAHAEPFVLSPGETMPSFRARMPDDSIRWTS